MLMALLTILLYLYQASFMVREQKPALSKVFKGVSHAIYLLLIISGFVLFWKIYQVAGMQAWILAKIVLLVVAVSANIKALRPSTNLPQAKAGFLISGIAYAGIVFLALAKPMW